MKKKQKNPYPRHLTRRIVIGVALTLFFMQLIVWIGNTLIYMISSATHVSDLSSGLIYSIQEIIDPDVLLECAHSGEKDSEFIQDERAVAGLQNAFSGTISYICILYGNEETGYRYLMDVDPDGSPAEFLEPFTALSPKQITELREEMETETEDGETYITMSTNGSRLNFSQNNNTVSGTAIKELTDRDSEEQLLLITAINFMSILTETSDYLVMIGAALLILVIIFIIILSIRLNKKTAAPLKKISGAVRDFVRQTKDEKNPDQWVYQTPDIRSKDEIQALADSVEEMTSDMKHAVSGLLSATKDKERMATELDLAYRIQSDMLPNQFPPFPGRSDFSIYASMDPAREVGGDFYDFFLIDEDHLGLVIADVSGKGIPAALFMMSSKITISSLAKEGNSPAQVLEKANNTICRNNQQEMFITVWCGILDLKTGLLKAANAGHEYPALRKAGGNFKLLKDRHGFVIGELENMKYQEYELQLRPGDTLFVYTDGIPECQNRKAEFFGTDRMLEALNVNPGAEPETIVHTVNNAFYKYMNGAPQFDDATMLCVKLPEQTEQ